MDDLLVILDMFTVVDYSKRMPEANRDFNQTCMHALPSQSFICKQTNPALQSISPITPTNNEKIKQAKKKDRFGI